MPLKLEYAHKSIVVAKAPYMLSHEAASEPWGAVFLTVFRQ